MSPPQKLEPCGCMVAYIRYSCNHETIRTILCNATETEPISPTSAEPDHFSLELKTTSGDLCDLCDLCAIMLILTQDTRATDIAALRLSEPARYDELMVDVPETPQLTYMGSMGSYERMDFDLPAISPDMYFSIDWDESQSTAESVVSKYQTNDDYTLPKLRYDPTAPGRATEDKFEEYVARKRLLPTANESKAVFNLHPAIVAGIEPNEELRRAGAQVASNLKNLGRDDSLTEVLSENELAESPIAGSSVYREICRELSEHDSDLTERVAAGSAFDLELAGTTRWGLRSSSMSSEHPSPPPSTGESLETMTVLTTVCQDTDGINRLAGGSPDIIRYVLRVGRRSGSSPPSLAEPPSIQLGHRARELRYRKVGYASLIDIPPRNPLKNSPYTSSRPVIPSTWPQVPTTSALKLGPPSHMRRRVEPTTGHLRHTVDKGIKKAVDTLFTRRGITTDHGPRPRPLSRRGASITSSSISPKQVRFPAKAARVAAKARKIRQWAKSGHYSDLPDSPLPCITEPTYEDGQYCTCWRQT